MSAHLERVAELEREWKHASEIAFQSIGQPDRAENVAWRDELAAKLRQAKAEARLADRRDGGEE